MNFSEFIRQLGSDPTSQDPEFLRARESAPEFVQAAQESDRFERQLGRALDVNPPPGWLQGLRQISRPTAARSRPWRHYAMAASLLVVIAAAGITWRMNAPPYDSVEEYVPFHYYIDGPQLLAKSEGHVAGNVAELLSQFQVEMSPEVSRMVGAIKLCSTPDGIGVHLVLNTERGPITVIFMPKTPVTDGEMLAFDGMEAQLVTLESGSAAVIGTGDQQIAGFYSLVQNSITPISAKA